MTLSGIFAGLLGAFLVMWTKSIGRLPKAQQPAFSRSGWFKGVPLVGLVLFLGGHIVAVRYNWILGGTSLVVALVLGTAALRQDQYSAMARIIVDDYLNLKKENPGASDFQIMYSIVKSHKPLWKEDRVLEFCAGKDLKQFVLLFLVLEYEIHPLNDMELYESVKVKVERLAARSE
jgi:hypothetical protein